MSYDEFAFLQDNAREVGLPFDRPPAVRRVQAPIGDGRSLSALVWGDAPARLVLLHGGAQNAHTWDTFALALGLSLVALDLTGHGHSDGPAEVEALNGPGAIAADVAAVLPALAPDAEAVVGMSLGGLTAIALAAAAPQLVPSLVLVDVLPGMAPEHAQHIADFVGGPPTFPSFDALLERTVAANPTRTESSLRRGILHNAEQLPDGTWRWRWARHLPADVERRRGERRGGGPLHGELSAELAALRSPLLLVRGMRPDSVLRDDDEARLRAARPDAQVVHVTEAGHSVQGDAPVELARIVRAFLEG